VSWKSSVRRNGGGEPAVPPARTLAPAEAREIYDGVGRLQDAQGRHEDRALRRLIAHADFEANHTVCEFGCGTGRCAAQLLSTVLPPDARPLAALRQPGGCTRLG
jgi:hypothetical protein